MPTAEQNVYLAQLLDSHATFTISSNGPTLTPRSRIELYLSDPTILVWCRTHYSGHLDLPHRRWRLSSAASQLAVLDAVLPHLTTKKHRAMILQQFVRLYATTAHHPRSPETLVTLNSYREQLRFSNSIPLPPANLPPPP